MSLSREWADRLHQFHEELQRQLFCPVGELSFHGFTTKERLRYETAQNHPCVPMPAGTIYGEKFGYAWFFTTLKIPAGLEGKRINLRFDLGGEGLVFVNGLPFGTNRADHIEHLHHHVCDLILTEQAVPGEIYEIAYEAYAGDGKREVRTGPIVDEQEFLTRPNFSYTLPQVGHTVYGIWNEDAYQLYLDMDVLMGLRNALPPDSMRVMEIDNALKKCVNALRMEEGREAMQESFLVAREILAPLLNCKNGSTAPTMYAFGHSHLDLAWLWTNEETVRKCGRSFSTQLHLMDLYPEYTFLQSQPYLYEQTKINYPELYSRIREKVRTGQFLPEGGMWVEADTNMPCGESLIRQFLYGKRFFREEFGVESELLWLPDVFGYSAVMPQIMKGCGIRYFATQKLAWSYNDCEPFPYSYFSWQGLDGSRVTAFLDRDYGAYTNSQYIIERYYARNSKDNCDTLLFPYGYGDGGAGPTRDHIENLRRMKDLEGVPKCIMSTPNDFFRNLEAEPYLPARYVGELYFSAHRGVYTSQAKVKRGNRKCEWALREADIWTALLGRRNDADQERWYKMLLLNQFHDILPGSGIAEIYQKARADYDQILKESSDYLHKLLCTSEADSITVFNSLSWERNALLPLPEGWTGASLNGIALPVQSCRNGLFVNVTLPAFGSCVLSRTQDIAVESVDASAQSFPVLENKYLHVEFAQDGSLARVYDKELDREWLCAPGNQMKMYRDIPRHFDAWDIDSTYLENPVELTEPAEFIAAETGPLFSRVVYRRRLHKSVLRQTVTLEASSRFISFETQIDWQESHKLLKVDFPFALHSEEMYNEIQYGYVKRPTHTSRRYDMDRFEVCNHRWSAIVEENRGAAVLNDCKYGISGSESTLSLSLLRASKAPDFHADIDQHTFTYAVCFWTGPFAESGIVQKGYELNRPPLVVSGAHSLPQQLSVCGDGVVIDTVKPAEDGNGIVIRAYQSMNMTARAVFHLTRTAVAVAEADMLESSNTRISFDGHSWSADFHPFEVKTFHVFDADAIN